MKESEVPSLPTETDFGITQSFAFMQRGLSAYSDYSDYIYVVDSENLGNKEVSESLKYGIANIIKNSISQLPDEYQTPQKKIHKITKDHVIVAFDDEVWNSFSPSDIQTYTLFSSQTNMPQFKRNYYKFNIKIFF